LGVFALNLSTVAFKFAYRCEFGSNLISGCGCKFDLFSAATIKLASTFYAAG